MTIAPPPGVDQLHAGGQTPGEDCGEAVVRSLLLANGTEDGESVRVIEQEANAFGDWPGDGTYRDTLVSILHRHGFPDARPFGQDGADNDGSLAAVERRITRSVMCVVLVRSDHMGYPDPGGPVTHWVLVYEDTGTWVRYMQPIGGVLQSCPADRFSAAMLGVNIDVGKVIGATPAPADDGDMTPDQAQQLQAIYNELTAENSMADRVKELHDELTELHSMAQRVLDLEQKMDRVIAKVGA